MKSKGTLSAGIFSLALLSACFAAFCAAEADERAVIEKVIRDNIGWALTKDRPLMESTMARDESLFIFNPTSGATIGWSQVEKNFDFWMDPRFKATACEIWDMRIGVSRSGDAAWWSCMLNDLAEWDGKPVGWKDTRWTGVLEKRDGRWLIVQMHFSFASDKVAAEAGAKLEAEKREQKAAAPDGGIDHPVLFYSGRNDNKDVYILHPGETEPRNLTNHPAQDLCPAASPDGKRVLFLSDREGNMDIFSMPPDGSGVQRLTSSVEREEHPEFTPDGKRILFVRDFEKRTEIWIMNADGSEARRLTRNEARDERPFLSPDGSKIVFMSNRDGNYEIYTMAPDGSGQTRLTNTPELEIFPVWSPDGTKIAYSQKYRADGRMEGMVRVMNADGSGDRPVTAAETRDENVMWSPDGRRILVQSVRDGNFEVYQVDLDGGRPIRLTNHPAWDGWACYLPDSRPNAEAVVYGPDALAAGTCPHGQLSFSPDGTGVFWSAIRLDGREQTIYHSVFNGTSFSKPVVAPFAAPSGNGGPAFSPDGKRLYFSAELPPADGSPAARTAICYVERTGSGWTKPAPVEPTVDATMTKGQVSVARSGNIYFSGRVLTEKAPGIYVCRSIDGRYSSPEKLAGPIAEAPLLVDPWIDPDERFLLVSCAPPEGLPMLTDIGISRRREDGSWDKPMRLGAAVNTGAFERFPSLSQDGKFLFFIRSLSEQFVGDQARFYRIDAKILGDSRFGGSK